MLLSAITQQARGTSRHQMTINGKTDDFTPEDFKAGSRKCRASSSGGKHERQSSPKCMDTVIKEWPRYAKTAWVMPGSQRDKSRGHCWLNIRSPRHPDVGGLQRGSIIGQ